MRLPARSVNPATTYTPAAAAARQSTSLVGPGISAAPCRAEGWVQPKSRHSGRTTNWQSSPGGKADGLRRPAQVLLKLAPFHEDLAHRQLESVLLRHAFLPIDERPPSADNGCLPRLHIVAGGLFP